MVRMGPAMGQCVDSSVGEGEGVVVSSVCRGVFFHVIFILWNFV